MLAMFFVARISLSMSNIGFPYGDDSGQYPTPQRHFISVNLLLFSQRTIQSNENICSTLCEQCTMKVDRKFTRIPDFGFESLIEILRKQSKVFSHRRRQYHKKRTLAAQKPYFAVYLFILCDISIRRMLILKIFLTKVSIFFIRQWLLGAWTRANNLRRSESDSKFKASCGRKR